MEEIFVGAFFFLLIVFFVGLIIIKKSKRKEPWWYEDHLKKLKKDYEREKLESVFQEHDKEIGGQIFKCLVFKENALKEFVPSQEGEKIFFFKKDLEPFCPWEQAEVEAPSFEWSIYRIKEDSLVAEIFLDRGYADRVTRVVRIPVVSLGQAKKALLGFMGTPPKGFVEELEKVI